LQDITETKKAEQRIKQSEANYRQLFKLSPAPMWVIDEETYRFTEVNQACLNNYGYSEEEFAGMTLMNISPQSTQTDVRSSVSKNQSSAFLTGSHRHIRKSGEIIEVETSSIPVVLNGKKQKLVIAMDVTEKNLYEQKLTRAAIKAQEDERYEIGGELHDNVCQILAMSLMRLGMIKKQLPEDSKEFFEQTHEYITLASEEIRNLSHRLAPAFFDNATLEDEFDTLLTNFNVENKYEITLSFENLPKNYIIERELQLNLYRILQEQLRNILKYADATRIEVEVAISKGTLQMKIADNGVGFDVESIKGGIGFTNMNRRAMLFSGDLTVDSTAGNGCRIFVNIPISNPN
jgi:PAS domain S-box-containing protein